MKEKNSVKTCRITVAVGNKSLHAICSTEDAMPLLRHHLNLHDSYTSDFKSKTSKQRP